jgi:hypothetical protein
MIEGLKLDFTTEELADHLSRRVEHHQERANFYEKQATALETGGAQAQQYSGGDPLRSLRDSLTQHLNRATLLGVMRDHLVPGETYRLDENDLLKIEILSGRMW